MAITIDSKLKDIMANEKAVAVLTRLNPAFVSNKQLSMAYGMTLRAVQKFPQAKMPIEQLAEIEKEFAAL